MYIHTHAQDLIENHSLGNADLNFNLPLYLKILLICFPLEALREKKVKDLKFI